MIAKKFVINDGDLIIGQVEMHLDLVKGMDYKKTVGGGRWYFDRPNNTMYFYGESLEFGQVTKEQFDKARKQPSIERAKLIFTTDLKCPIVI